MNFRGIILTGTSGAGKSTLSDQLHRHDPAFEQVKAVTTRAQRADDEAGSYAYLSEDAFTACEPSLVIWAEYRGKRYGITREHIAEVESRGKVPVLLITPKSLAEYLRRGDGADRLFLTIFVDAPDEILDARRDLRGDAERVAAATVQRAEDRIYRGSCLHQLQNIQLDEAIAKLLAWWRSGGAPAC